MTRTVAPDRNARLCPPQQSLFGPEHEQSHIRTTRPDLRVLQKVPGMVQIIFDQAISAVMPAVSW